jgi:hypothetical protein
MSNLYEEIRLFPDEVAAAVAVASRRRIECNRKRRNAVKFEQDGAQRWGVEIEAACAEIAVARVLNLAWTGMSGIGQADVGDLVEVRHSIHPGAHLVLYPDDCEVSPFVLVTGRDGVYSARGWVLARDGRVPMIGAEKPDGSWWVPQIELRPMAELRRILTRNLAARLRDEDERKVGS